MNFSYERISRMRCSFAFSFVSSLQYFLLFPLLFCPSSPLHFYNLFLLFFPSFILFSLRFPLFLLLLLFLFHFSHFLLLTPFFFHFSSLSLSRSIARSWKRSEKLNATLARMVSDCRTLWILSQQSDALGGRTVHWGAASVLLSSYLPLRAALRTPLGARGLQRGPTPNASDARPRNHDAESADPRRAEHSCASHVYGHPKGALLATDTSGHSGRTWDSSAPNHEQEVPLSAVWRMTNGSRFSQDLFSK